MLLSRSFQGEGAVVDIGVISDRGGDTSERVEVGRHELDFRGHADGPKQAARG
jgi:hypothetical protein